MLSICLLSFRKQNTWSCTVYILKYLRLPSESIKPFLVYALILSSFFRDPDISSCICPSVPYSMFFREPKTSSLPGPWPRGRGKQHQQQHAGVSVRPIDLQEQWSFLPSCCGSPGIPLLSALRDPFPLSPFRHHHNNPHLVVEEKHFNWRATTTTTTKAVATTVTS